MSDNSKYFNSAISVNCVVFTYVEEKLKILLIRREFEPFKGLLALPGGLIYPNEDLQQAVSHIIESITGNKNVYKKQLQAFTDTKRHPSGRVVSIAYLALVNHQKAILKDSSFAISPDWFNILEKPQLVFDHDSIAETALQHLQSEIRNKPIIFELLDEKFTLPQLQTLYETILNISLDKRNFRRKLAYLDFIEDTEEMQKNPLYRPAKLYVFNKEKYNEFCEKGMVFSL